MIVSNPPYIPTEVIRRSWMPEVQVFMNRIEALDGKEDGLYFYRKIVDRVRQYLTDWRLALMFEIGYDQGADVAKMMTDEIDLNRSQRKRIWQDLTGS
ncbi:MAG: hypothetical protein ACLR78_00480 [Roseburia sp.]